ncbi:ComEC/Rec2 family competence protein [Pseudarthrobacter sp. B907]|uniref:ComEC/Rec2 family competence protein n=1 Tax=Pseudarthrobacter sp. B907 TaxID=3158261 RepID=UPI0032DBEB11
MAGEQGRRWQSFRDAAAATTAPATAPEDGAPGAWARLGIRAAGSGQAALTWIHHRVRAAQQGRSTGSTEPGRRRRTDLRLVPAALLVWGTALAAGRLEPPAIAGLCTGLVAAALALLAPWHWHWHWHWHRHRHRRGRPMPATRSLRATAAAALLLSCATAAHAAVASMQRHEGAVAEAVAGGASVIAELEVAGVPRQLGGAAAPRLTARWAVPATALVLVFDGRWVESRTALLVLGGDDWATAEPGQRIRTTGRLKPAGAGGAEAGMLTASSAPVRLSTPAGWQRAPAGLRHGFSAAAAGLPGDARGLLPGMVTGDTAALDPQLAAAMKTVGMTHLTAVSGANCSLILGALMLAARSLRFSRAFSAVLSIAGLGLFVLMVGPDASVLRAAVMGAIGLLAVAGGRPGRGLSFLCLAVIVLVLAQPALSTSFGFLLSVLATLGIVVAGRPIMAWFPAAVPRWLAAGLAVPLSAQAFCGPAIVLLQPQFSSYALPANMAAAVLVAPVTLLGTAAVPLVPLAPALAAVPLGIAAAYAAGVGAVARFFAGLPGAVLPWPEGAFGAATMALFAACTFTAWWLLFHPARTVDLAFTAHRRTVALLNRILPRGDGMLAPPGGSRPGMVHRQGRGRLRVCNRFSGRKPL